jgi:hypothetical protein
VSGEALTVDSARVALVLYVAALVAMLGRRGGGGMAGRALWTAGMLVYLVHVCAAFHVVHGWSHGAAVAETARQTRALFGVDTGVGIWFNYLFTAVWAADAAWWWLDPGGYHRRPAAATGAVHAFMAFMFFNGAVVFASGPSRWIGLAATALLPLWWLWRRRTTRS